MESIYTDDLSSHSLSQNIIDDNEGVAIALVSPDGLSKKDGYRQSRVDVPVGMVVTDKRLVFAAVESDGSDAGDLRYADIAGIELERSALVLATTDGVHWRFPLANPESEPVDIAVRHLCWIGKVRSRLLSLSNDVELASGKIRTHVADFEWDDALATYREIRQRLDGFISEVQATPVLSDAVLVPELTEIDRQLEAVCARLFIERSRSQLELGQQLIQYEDFEQARTLFEEAYAYYERATWHSEEVHRADSFQFGQQRELADNLKGLQWEIESAAAEPLQQANEAMVQAEAAETVEKEVQHLETALNQYRGVLTLEWSDDRQFTGDPETATEAVQQAGTALIELHEQIARKHWNDGSRLEAAGDFQTAIETCGTALEHLERAHTLAEEFDPQNAQEFEGRLKTMFEFYLDMRTQAGRTDSAEVTSEDVPEPLELDEGSVEPIRLTDSDGDDEGNSTDTAGKLEKRSRNYPPTIEELSQMDTHHEITLDLNGTEGTDAFLQPDTDTDTVPADEPDDEHQERPPEANEREPL